MYDSLKKVNIIDPCILMYHDILIFEIPFFFAFTLPTPFVENYKADFNETNIRKICAMGHNFHVGGSLADFRLEDPR